MIWKLWKKVKNMTHTLIMTQKSIECPEVFMGWSNLSDHMMNGNTLQIMLVICGPNRGLLVCPEVRELYARASSTFISGWPQ